MRGLKKIKLTVTRSKLQEDYINLEKKNTHHIPRSGVLE